MAWGCCIAACCDSCADAELGLGPVARLDAGLAFAGHPTTDVIAACAETGLPLVATADAGFASDARPDAGLALLVTADACLALVTAACAEAAFKLVTLLSRTAISAASQAGL